MRLPVELPTSKVTIEATAYGERWRLMVRGLTPTELPWCFTRARFKKLHIPGRWKL